MPSWAPAWSSSYTAKATCAGQLRAPWAIIRRAERAHRNPSDRQDRSERRQADRITRSDRTSRSHQPQERGMIAYAR